MNSRSLAEHITDRDTNVTMLPTMPSGAPPTLRECAKVALQSYFADLNGQQPCELYSMVLAEIEQPLFQTVMEYTRGNQSRASAILGINRGTLRKKLRQYGINA